MSNKPQNYFAKGILSYPHLKTPDTKFAKGGSGHYGFGLIVDAAEHERLLGIFTPIRDDFVNADDEKEMKEDKGWTPSLPFNKQYDKETKKATGNFIWNFKQNASFTKENGEVITFSITIIDAATKPTNAEPWGGSVVKTRFTAKPYGMGATKDWGISFRPNCVQVIELVTGGAGGNTEGFGEEEGFTDDGSCVDEEVEAPVGSDGSDGADF